MYNEVLQLREKVIALGAKDPGKPDEIGLIQCTSEKEKRFDSQIPIQIESTIINNIPECDINNEFMENIELNLQSIPNSLTEFCKKVLNDRMEIVTWVMEYDHQDCENDFALNEKIEIFRNEDNELIEKLENTKREQFELIENLTKKFESLWIECQSYRENFKNSKNNEQNFIEVEKLKNLLNSEMEKSQKLKEGKSHVESQMTKLRSKLRDFEIQVNNGEGKINQLQNSVEQLKSQLKQKEIFLEQQTKDVQKSARSNKSAINKLESQKENLESRFVCFFIFNFPKKIGKKIYIFFPT